MKSLRQLVLLRALAEQGDPPRDKSELQHWVGPEGSLAELTAACFFLYRPNREDGASRRDPDLLDFLERTVPRLLAQLNRSTRPEYTELRGRVRGSVDWAGTLKARAGASSDDTLFVCRQTGRQHDLPENRLLKHVLHALRDALTRTPVDVRGWSHWPPSDEKPDGDRLALIAHRLNRSLKSAYLSDVELPAVIDGEHELAALGSRNPLYVRVLELRDFYVRAVERPDWTTWRRVVRESIDLVPAGGASALERLGP